MIEVAAVAASIAAFVLAGGLALSLMRGAPRAEWPLWIGLFVLMMAGAVQRAVLATRLGTDSSIHLPSGLLIALAASPLAIVIIFLVMHPVLQNYRAAERRRQESDEAFYRSLGMSRDPLAIINGTGRYQYVNDAGCEFFRYRRDQILGHDFREFVTDIERTPRGFVQRALQSGTAQVEVEVFRGDGSRLTIECDLIALGDGRVLFTGRDLTPRREAEAAHLRAERLAAIRTLSTLIGTDFADMLSFVKSSLDLTAEFGSERVPVDAPIAATMRALDLIREFAALSAQSVASDQPQPPPIDIRPVIRDAVQQMILQRDERTQLEFEDETSPIMIHAEPADIARVCLGLLSHASAAIDESLGLKAKDDGFVGRLSVVVHQIPSTDSLRPSEVEIVVADNGGALSADVRAHMFEPLFHDLSRRLGLGATHAVVLRLGGTMDIRRQRGGGTTVTVRLPIAETPREVAAG